jgi:AbrB family looped-hinge helix DNA binding protein
MRAMARITSKGQVTIPKEIRDSIHVTSGDRVDFAVRDDGVVEMRRVGQPGTLEELLAMRVHVPAELSVADIDREIGKSVSQDWDRSRGRW